MTDRTHNWYAIKFPQDRFPFATPQPLVDSLNELWEKNSFPDDFCVFQEIDENYVTIQLFTSHQLHGSTVHLKSRMATTDVCAKDL